MDDIFCDDISRCSLCTEYHGDRGFRLVAALDIHVFVNSVQGVHLLAFVLMKTLPMENGDSVLCVVKSFAGPEKESELYFFNQEWKVLDASRFLGGKRMEDLAETLVQKPDTMSESRFADLKAMIEPKMVSALLLQNENALVVRLASPLLSADDKKVVNVIKLQRKFNWNGKSFKES